MDFVGVDYYTLLSLGCSSLGNYCSLSVSILVSLLLFLSTYIFPYNGLHADEICASYSNHGVTSLSEDDLQTSHWTGWQMQCSDWLTVT